MTVLSPTDDLAGCPLDVWVVLAEPGQAQDDWCVRSMKYVELDGLMVKGSSSACGSLA